MSKYIPFVIVLATLCIAPALSAGTTDQEPCKDPCGKPTAWQDFNSFSLKAKTPNASDFASYDGSFDKETGDILIDVAISQDGATKKGKIMMVGGRVMATQGPITEPGYEIDALDGAILQLQLVTKLLGRAVPEGPAAIKSAQHVDFSDARTGIQIATPSAGGMMPAPWRVVGELKRGQLDGVDFDLAFTFPSREGKGTTTMSFSGKLFNATNTKIDDQMQLATWNMFGVGPQSRKQGDATILDYSAAPETSTYKTVADVRRKLAADDYVGEPDASKDFTGFWKTKCEDPFGLQVKHYGNDGKYSIVFCGPGGCGDPENEGSKSFISKDPHYQIISEDELKEQTSSGWETYHRCTKETNPILKYKDDNY